MTEDELFDKWKKWFYTFAIADIEHALDGDSLQIGLIILSLIATEALSGYYCGRPADRGTFVSFVERYFPPEYVPYASDIYASLRNGLAHDYIVKGTERAKNPFYLNGKVGEPHLQRVNADEAYPIAFNRVQVAKDLLVAWRRYSREAESEPELFARVQRRIAARGFMIVE